MSKRVFTVLAIDGGGVKGVIPARILQEIEERTGKPISELFDLVAGTSTGAIVAGSLTVPSKTDPKKPRYSAKDTVELYKNHSSDIFPIKKFRELMGLINPANAFYDAASFEKILEDYFEDIEFRESLTHLMMAGADMKAFEPVWMHYFLERQKATQQRWESLRYKDAIRASASAPTFFETKYIETRPNKLLPDARERHAMLDGGLFAATVPRRALTQAKKLAPPDAEIVVVHVGTGRPRTSMTPDEMNKKSGLDWVRSSKGATVLGISIEFTMRDIENDVYEELGGNFYRLDGFIEPDDPDAPDNRLDNATEDNINKLVNFAERLINENDDVLEDLCQTLVAKAQADQLHIESRKALHTLTEQISTCESTNELGNLYTKIVTFSSDIQDPKVDTADEELFETCQHLNERHKGQLAQIYTAHHNTLKDLEADKPKGIKRLFGWFGGKKKKKGAAEKPKAPMPSKPKSKGIPPPKKTA